MGENTEIEVVVIRSATDVDQVKGVSDSQRKNILACLNDFKQFAFVAKTGQIVAAIDKNDNLMVSLDKQFLQ